MNRLPEKVIIKALQDYLDIPEDRYIIAAQNYKIPNIKGLFVIVAAIDGDPITNDSYYLEKEGTNFYPLGYEPNEYEKNELPDGQYNVIQTTMFYEMQIDFVSRDNIARDKRDEIIASLNAFINQELQVKYGCRIFPLTVKFYNTSGLEGGAILNRFTVRFKMTLTNAYYKTTMYYEQFNKKEIYK